GSWPRPRAGTEARCAVAAAEARATRKGPELEAAPLLLSGKQAAEALGLARSVFWRLVSEGRLPNAVAVPGIADRRWRREDLEAWVNGLRNWRPGRRGR